MPKWILRLVLLPLWQRLIETQAHKHPFHNSKYMKSLHFWSTSRLFRGQTNLQILFLWLQKKLSTMELRGWTYLIMKMHSVCVLGERESTFGESESGKKHICIWTYLIKWKCTPCVCSSLKIESTFGGKSGKVEKPSLRFCGEYYWNKSNCNNSNCWIVSWGFIVTNQITE